MLSLGMLAARALSITRRSRGLPFGSPPPIRAAVAISRISLVKTLPRLASMAPFLRRIVAHLEWPDMSHGVSTGGPFRPTPACQKPFSFARFGPQAPARSADTGAWEGLGSGPRRSPWRTPSRSGSTSGPATPAWRSRKGRNVEVLPNAFGESITASVVHFQEDGSIVVGNAAKAHIIHDPKHTVYSAKRLIGRFFFSDEVKKAQAVCPTASSRGRTTASASRSATSSSRCPRSPRWCCRR